MVPRALLPVLLGATAAAQAPLPPVHHDLAVALDPARGALEVEDRLSSERLAAGREDGVVLHLHAGLELRSGDPACRVTREGPPDESGGVPRQAWRLEPADGRWSGAPVALRYEGRIHHPLQAEEQEYARSFSRTPGIVCAEGAVLSGASGWVPVFGDELVTFRLEVRVPADWDVVSQGRRTLHAVEGGERHVTWECPHPMDEVHLVAAPFTEYSRPAGRATAQAFLRAPDPALANRYLEVTQQYLDLYGRLIGPYPFEKFALVENFWETGYGMPSFTLLGPQVIRLPFILHSSYPHEILHNWWGNSVFVAYEGGNWCEGLTAYLADHLVKEGQGAGEEYRRDALKKYRAYVGEGQDFPLSEFRSRHSSATEAVGYGKALMVFHMLRRELGDGTFAAGLQALYREHRFARASWDDLAAAFGAEAGRDLSPFFRQWVRRAGAPALAARVEGGALVLEQTQAGEPFRLTVPLALSVEGEAEARLAAVDMQARTARLALPEGWRRVDVDPHFDLFRLLDRRELPPTLGEVFGAQRVTLVLPADPGPWRALAEAWRTDGVEVVGEDELQALPADRACWILGGENRLARAVMPALEERGAALSDDALTLGAARHPRADLSFALVAPHPADPELAVGWIGTGVPAAVPGLARKLPHYGKYSYLAFAGEAPDNVAKGQWEPAGSPLVVHPERPRAALDAREPLGRLAPLFQAERLMAHVRALADDRLEGRGSGTPGADAAAEYVAGALAEAGLEVTFQDWEEPGGPEGEPVRLRNVVAAIPGTNPAFAGQSVVVGAHYDHLGRGWPDVRAGEEGQVHNGADDNASGVAVLLELARVLVSSEPPRTIVLVAFAGEEWGLKGSRHYLRATTTWPADGIRAMVNLDTVGRLGEGPLTLLGTGTADEWRHIAMGVGYTTGVEARCIPQDPGGSDQVAFQEAGVPAVQVFTGAHADYHRPSDDVERIDGEGLVAVATFVRESVAYLAEREPPLTSSLAGAAAPPAGRPAQGGERRVSLGTVPDFAFEGPGVRVDSVLEGSAAEHAGVRAGDVLLSLGEASLATLRDLSEALRACAPGDRVALRVRRGDRELTFTATLTAR